MNESDELKEETTEQRLELLAFEVEGLHERIGSYWDRLEELRKNIGLGIICALCVLWGYEFGKAKQRDSSLVLSV